MQYNNNEVLKMADNFNNVWETLSTLNMISPIVTAEIDILRGANPEFINFVADLETTQSLEERAKKAIAYIDKNNGLKEIAYPTLGQYLSNYNSVSLDIWRKLYVLERSITPRFGVKYTWLERLKIFYNTYVREKAVDGRAIYNGKKLYWIKGNKDNPTNHDKLVYGSGKWAPDFYFFDDDLPGTETWQKMVKVEMKHGEDDIDAEIAKHADDKFLYNAKYLLLAMANGSYYMINYNKKPAEATKLNITCQDTFKV